METSTPPLVEASVNLAELQSLSAEITELFYRQAVAPEDLHTEEEICRAFATTLLKHWQLCIITVLLRTDDDDAADMSGERWRKNAIFTNQKYDREVAGDAARLLADATLKHGSEVQFWLADNGYCKLQEDTTAHEVFDKPDKIFNDAAASINTDFYSPQVHITPTETVTLNGDEAAPVRQAFEQAGIKAGIAIPVRAHGEFAGALVTLCDENHKLARALAGVRVVSAPIVVALSNINRARALRAKQSRIAALVTDLRTHGEQLEDANKELQRVGRYRSMFLARMSHELRTPLTSILGFTEILLEQEDLTATQRRFIEKIQASGLQQQQNLNQLVDLSRLEAGHHEVFLHEFSLKKTIDDVCESLKRLAHKADVQIERNTLFDSAGVISDESRLRQIIYNFLTFAISRSAPQGIVYLHAQHINTNAFRLTITDNGEPLEDPEHIFETFDAMSKQDERGVTLDELGLVIARRLIDVLGGTVKVEELEPRGLRVTLDFARI